MSMSIIAKFTLVCIVLLSTISCEKVITVKLPVEQAKIVVNSYSYTGDTIFVAISRSDEIQKYKYNKDLTVRNATVVLYESGVAIDTLIYDNESELYLSHTIAQAGQMLSIHVNAPGFEEAVAECLVPALVSINSVQRNFNIRLDDIGNQQDEILLEFDDPATTGDYYIVKVNIPHDSFEMFYCVNTTDASVETIYDDPIDQNTCISSDGIFMRDNLFNGGKKVLRLYMSHNFLQNDTLAGEIIYPEIQLLHVGKEHYKYEKSYQYSVENGSDPFSEPANPYTNIKNGYGIFSVISNDTREIK